MSKDYRNRPQSGHPRMPPPRMPPRYPVPPNQQQFSHFGQPHQPFAVQSNNSYAHQQGYVPPSSMGNAPAQFPPFAQPMHQGYNPQPAYQNQRFVAPRTNSPRAHNQAEAPPPAYDQVCPPTSKKKSNTSSPINNELQFSKQSLHKNDAFNIEERKEGLGEAGYNRGARQPERGEKKGPYIGRGRGRGSYKYRSGRGKLRGGRFASYSNRGSHRGRGEVDRGSEVTTSSIGQEQDELSMMLQRQLIGELDFADTNIDSKAILIEVRNGFSVYDPFALKNFLEYCTGCQSKVMRMVVASDTQSVVAVFDNDIDCDELEAFVTEPQNQFLDLELDFEEVKELSAVIAFTLVTDEDEEDVIVEKLELLSPGIGNYVRDCKQSDDVALLSFQNINQKDIWRLIDASKDTDIELYPLYPYPKPEYMHVITASFLNFELSDDIIDDDTDGYKVMLSQVNIEIGDKALKKVMTVEKLSGGDSSAKVSETSNDCVSQKLVTYSKPEVCVRVMSHSPIKMLDGNMVGYPCLRVDVPVPKDSGVSSYFLMLTGVSDPKLTKDIIRYFCTNHTRHPVLQVYFTGDEQSAVVMFSSDSSAREPGFTDLYEGLAHTDSVMSGVMAWRLLPVTRVHLSAIEGSVKKKVDEGLRKWKDLHRVNCEMSADQNTAEEQTATIEFSSEKDTVSFLSRSSEDVSFGKFCLESPDIPAIASSKLYSERSKSLSPPSLSVSNLVEELGYSEDYIGYVKSFKDKKLPNLYQRCQIFYHTTLHEFRYDTKGLGNASIDVVKHMKGWQRHVKDSLDKYLSELKAMDEQVIKKSSWFEIKKKVPGSLFLVEERDGAMNMKIRALGTAGDVKKLEQLLGGVSPGKDLSKESVTFSTTDANFIKFNHFSKLKEAHPDTTMNLEFGSELATMSVEGKADDIQRAKAALEEFKSNLQRRNLTVPSPHWEFLNHRQTRAYRYVNEILLDGVQYFCTTKGTHKLVTLTSISKELLTKAEKVMREQIISETLTINSLQQWTEHTKPVIEQFWNGRWPLHIIEPTGDAGNVTIVTVRDAKETLDAVLSKAHGVKGTSSSSAVQPKKNDKTNKKNTKKPKPVTPILQSSSDSDSDLGFHTAHLRLSESESNNSGARPKKQIQPQPMPRSDVKVMPLMDTDRPNVGMNSPGIRELHGRNSPLDTRGRHGSGENNEVVEEVKLSMSNQYIEYQYLTHYMGDVRALGPCQIEKEDRSKSIKIKSYSSEVAKNQKKRLLDMIRKLHKETREVKQGTNEAMFQRAAIDLKLRFLLNRSVELMDYAVGSVSVKACKPSIQCIKADGIIIAVTNELYMTQSGVGRILSTADQNASRELRSRYDEDTLDDPGSCQELDSQSHSVLWDFYLVIVVDPNDKHSLARGFKNALERCESLGLSSVVTNLIGSDMKGFVNDKESAASIMRSLSEHVRSREKLSLRTLYLCETNDYKLRSLTSEIKKYGKGVEFVDTSLPDIGSTMISICARSKQDANEFFSKCAIHLI